MGAHRLNSCPWLYHAHMLCACGCGETTPISSRTVNRYGRVKGQPMKWATQGHSKRKSPVEYIVDAETGCWVWQRAASDTGYGTISGRQLAHRMVYERHRGPIPAGYELDHLCRNRICVNPEHLEPVTHRENQRRGNGPPGLNARRTHCVHGHEFTPANTYIRPDNGNRRCRTCNAVREAARCRRPVTEAKEVAG